MPTCCATADCWRSSPSVRRCDRWGLACTKPSRWSTRDTRLCATVCSARRLLHWTSPRPQPAPQLSSSCAPAAFNSAAAPLPPSRSPSSTPTTSSPTPRRAPSSASPRAQSVCRASGTRRRARGLAAGARGRHPQPPRRLIARDRRACHGRPTVSAPADSTHAAGDLLLGVRRVTRRPGRGASGRS